MSRSCCLAGFTAVTILGLAGPALITAQEHRLRIGLGYDDADGPMCHLAHLRIEWAD